MKKATPLARILHAKWLWAFGFFFFSRVADVSYCQIGLDDITRGLDLKICHSVPVLSTYYRGDLSASHLKSLTAEFYCGLSVIRSQAIGANELCIVATH